MIKFTQTRRDWDDLALAKRMLRAGADGYKSLHYQLDWDDYVLLSTATEKQLKEKFTDADLDGIFQLLETVGEKKSKEFLFANGETILLYWEIDRYSGYPSSGYQEV